MTRIIFVRHGESQGNLTRTFLGHTDWDLTPLGYQQAEQVKKALKDIQFDAIYSSDLSRAYHTVEVIASNWDIPIIKEQGFREIYAGKWEGMRYDEIEGMYPDSYHTFRENIGLAEPDGGESTVCLGMRGKAALDAVVEKHKGGTILIATHAAVLCMLLCTALGIPPQEAQKLGLSSNASITTLVERDGEYTLICYGDTKHLGEYKSKRAPLA